MISNLFKLLIIFSMAIFTGCSYNSSFYYTKSEYNDIKDIDYEDVYLTNDEGVKLNAVYMEPKGKAKGSVLLIHGNGGNVSGWIYSIKPLVDAGYRAIVFDYQGYGKSKGEPNHKNVVTDAEMFLNYLIKRANKDGKIVIWGCSLGGNLSVNIANRNQYKVDALIDEAGFSSHSDIAAAMMPWFIKPFARLTVAAPYSSKKIIKNVKIPVLIIHSTEDETVPFKMGEKVYNNANQPKEFWKIKGKHCYAITDYKNEFIAKLDSLIEIK